MLRPQNDRFSGSHQEKTRLVLFSAFLHNVAQSGWRSAARRSLSVFSLCALAFCAVLCAPALAQNKVLPGHRPAILARSQLVGRTPGTETLHLAFSLPLRQQPQLKQLLSSLYDPTDPQYGHYLTPAQFAAQFGPTQEDYQKIAAFAEAHGLRVTQKHPTRTILDVQGTASAVEAAFGVHLMQYRAPSGRVFRAPDTEPSLPADIASRLAGIVGLDNAAVRRPHARIRRADQPKGRQPHQGSGPMGGLTPDDLKTAYNLNGTGLNGAGQAAAVLELDAYNLSDVEAYESYFGFPNVPLHNILLDGVTGRVSDASGQQEVTLDIEMLIALAPNVMQIYVYEAPDDDAGTGALDATDRIASDDLAKVVSICWGSPEDQNPDSYLNAENTAFMQMASQGQSVFVASGDDGAYDDGTSLSVDDPSSQPYTTGVGATTLTANGPGGSYLSETTWNADPGGGPRGAYREGATGGGVSGYWPIPSFQEGVIGAGSYGSTTMRNVPDVSVNGDPNEGYAIYVQGGWSVFGGTSSSTPLWAGLTLLINQKRATTGLGPLGFVNPTLYGLAKGQRYGSDFHDIDNGSANGYYPAVEGYDCATGWGSFNGTNLLNDLAGGIRKFLWQNTSTGQLVYWNVADIGGVPTLSSYSFFGPSSLPAVWRMAGAPISNVGGAPDLLWENTQTGDVYWWPMVYPNGVPTLFNAGGYLDHGVDLSWRIAGVGDFNGDGISDILWQNTQTGDVYWWEMGFVSGFPTLVTSGYVSYGVPLQWRIAAVADFNGDGKPDILWQNTETGDVYWWEMGFVNGVPTPLAEAYVAHGIPLQWRIAGAADVNGDGEPDIIWQNMQTGDVYWWAMSYTNGALNFTPAGYIAQGISLQWYLAVIF